MHRPEPLSGQSLFGRLPVEVLFVRLCVCLCGMHYAIAASGPSLFAQKGRSPTF